MTTYNPALHMTLTDIENYSGVCPFDSCSILSINKIKELGFVDSVKKKNRFFDKSVMMELFTRRVFDINLSTQFLKQPLNEGITWKLSR